MMHGSTLIAQIPFPSPSYQKVVRIQSSMYVLGTLSRPPTFLLYLHCLSPSRFLPYDAAAAQSQIAQTLCRESQ